MELSLTINNVGDIVLEVWKTFDTMKHFVYIVKCSDGTLYTGYTVDVKRRLWEHNNSKRGAKYTKVRRPVKLYFFEEFDSKSLAMKREYEIKQLSRSQKLNLK